MFASLDPMPRTCGEVEWSGVDEVDGGGGGVAGAGVGGAFDAVAVVTGPFDDAGGNCGGGVVG